MKRNLMIPEVGILTMWSARRLRTSPIRVSAGIPALSFVGCVAPISTTSFHFGVGINCNNQPIQNLLLRPFVSRHDLHFRSDYIPWLVLQ